MSNRLLREFKKEHTWICHYCDQVLTKENVSVDHLIPKSRGGNSEESNLVMCCNKCNKEKGNMTEEEYREYLKTKNNEPVRIEDIKILYLFEQTVVRESKVRKAIDYYNQYGKFDKPITLKSFRSKRLMDGYSRYLAAKQLNIRELPVVYKFG